MSTAINNTHPSFRICWGTAFCRGHSHIFSDYFFPLQRKVQLMFKPNSQFRTKGFLAYANAMASEHISIFRRELTNHFISNEAAPQSAYVRGLVFSGRSIKYQSLTLHNRREQAHSLTRAIPTYDSHRLTNPALRPSAPPWCIPTLDGAGIILPKIRKKRPQNYTWISILTSYLELDASFRTLFLTREQAETAQPEIQPCVQVSYTPFRIKKDNKKFLSQYFPATFTTGDNKIIPHI